MKGQKIILAMLVLLLSTTSPYTYSASIFMASGEIHSREGYSHFRSAMNLVTSDNVIYAENYNDYNEMLSHDALWIDLRFYWEPGFTENELSNISAFIDSGKKVVFIGDNQNAYSDWNDPFLNLVGGETIGDYPTGEITPILEHQLTNGVSTLNMNWAGITSGGTSLFSEDIVTLWGDNVLTILEANLFHDENLNDSLTGFNNFQFMENTLNWTAGTEVQLPAIPIPSSIWLMCGGLLSLINIARRKT